MAISRSRPPQCGHARTSIENARCIKAAQLQAREPFFPFVPSAPAASGGAKAVASAPGVPGAASVRVQHVMSRLTGGRDAATTRGARSSCLCSRDEHLNVELFFSVADAQRKLLEWQRDYNEDRPHSLTGEHVPSGVRGPVAVNRGRRSGEILNLEPVELFGAGPAARARIQAPSHRWSPMRPGRGQRAVSYVSHTQEHIPGSRNGPSACRMQRSELGLSAHAVKCIRPS